MIFLDACKEGDIKTVDNLIDQIPKSPFSNIINRMRNDIFNINIQCPDGYTGLIYAARNGHESIIDTLIKSGADLDRVNINGQTALMCAAREGNIGTIRRLIEAGAYDCGLPYKIAKMNNDAPVMFEFNRGIVTEQDTFGNTILITACERPLSDRNQENIFFLYEHGADFHMKNNSGESAIDILEKHAKLPLKLKSLIEKIQLEQHVNDCDEVGHYL